MKKKSKSDGFLKEMEERIVRHLGVLLEQIRSEGRTVMEGHGYLDKQIKNTHEQLGGQIKEVRVQLEGQIKGLHVQLDGQITEVHQQLGGQITEVKEDMKQRFDRLENSFGHVLQNHEKRIKKLEDKVAV